jgi:hypothetical protein
MAEKGVFPVSGQATSSAGRRKEPTMAKAKGKGKAKAAPAKAPAKGKKSPKR